MIDYDYAPTVFAAVIIFATLAPFFYSLFVDNYDKKSPQIRSNKS